MLRRRSDEPPGHSAVPWAGGANPAYHHGRSKCRRSRSPRAGSWMGTRCAKARTSTDRQRLLRESRDDAADAFVHFVVEASAEQGCERETRYLQQADTTADR